MDIDDEQPVAGPSRLPDLPEVSSPEASGGPLQQPSEGYITIPSYGLDYFDYRRAVFLSTPAGQPLPLPPPATASSLHETHMVPVPPPPLPSRPSSKPPSAAIERVETLLAYPGAEEDDLAWKAGVEGVARSLTAGKKLSRPIRLGLVIKILRATWLRDGTWPTDPRTSRAVLPPDSPTFAETATPTMPPSSEHGADSPPLPGLAGLMGYHGTPATGFVDLPFNNAVTAVRQTRAPGPPDVGGQADNRAR